MYKDRAKICEIISEMLDNPGKCEIYPTKKAYDALEQYVDQVRAEAIGWSHADDCTDLDKGVDPREKDCGDMLERGLRDLSKESDGA